MSLVLRRESTETWLEAALRAAKRFGLEEEVKEDYDSFILVGQDEAHAAFNACYKWDLLDFQTGS